MAANNQNFTSWDDYFQPNTNQQVLKNKLGIEDAQTLSKFEKSKVRQNKKNLPPVSLDFKGLQDIHKHLFGDVYEWAGQLRQVNMMKEGKPFTNFKDIEKKRN